MGTTITINGMEWAVHFVGKSHSALTDDSGTQDAYGVTLFRTGEIYIDSGLPKELMRQTVTHELVHALRFSYGECIDFESEEKICDFIAAHFDELKTLRKAVLKAL
ncbi:MAG: hypothetical protein K2N38_13590 [Oscillospiraceae bacterium]|nr:hypothetical protein [Oscillospiraceae bacterium]